jgi:hypothetical protein
MHSSTVSNETKRPVISIKTSGNLFVVLGAAARALQSAKQEDKIRPMRDRTLASKNYHEALVIIREYVEIK